MVVGAATTTTNVLWIPSWWLVAGGAMLVGAGAVLGRARRQGECSACRYSSVGLAPGARCPECGASGNTKEAAC